MTGTVTTATLKADLLTARLDQLYDRTDETPLFNPVAQLGADISKALEADTVSLGDIAALLGELDARAFDGRAKRLADFLALEKNNGSATGAPASSDDNDVETFVAACERPTLTCVFTAHPTFLLPAHGYDALATRTAGKDVRAPTGERAAPTLVEEHDSAIAALTRAAHARDDISARIIALARENAPDLWRRIRPRPFAFGTWVGYDMDGRTDIDWSTPVRFRLEEKVVALKRHLATVNDVVDGDARLQAVADRLALGVSHAESVAAHFAQPLKTPDAISAAANAATNDNPERITSLDLLLAQMDAVIADADDDFAARLIPIASAMRSERLGIGTVHFRINAAQLHNAIRRRLGDAANVSMSSRTAIARLRQMIDGAEATPVNFGALAIESTTAIRQFIAMAQMLKHVDTDSPIRLLIAECEQPATVLSALYFARLFGIEDSIDISPLFETSEALEHGGRFLDALLAEPAYREYARKRGRIAIQTGFSDAGRFMGQIPAALAIERLQGRLARLMEKHGLTGVEAVIFNTHGESMGRGAHPLSMEERLTHPMSAWARGEFAARGIPLVQEASFQGGDGYLWFGSDRLAAATLARIASAQTNIAIAAKGAAPDPFYDEVDVSLDFYRDVRRVQARMFRDPSYNRALTAFGLGLLPQTGSRKARRQTDLASDRDMSLRRIRAIPHNSILQQLGYPANVIAGIGEATASERDSFADLYARSPRAQALLRLVAASDRLASIKTLVAYGEMFNGAYWATRPYRGAEPELEPACLDLAERLVRDDRTTVFRELATQLRVDGLKLRRLIDLLPAETLPPRDEPRRRTLGVLHAVRLALMQHIFLSAASIPAFSTRNDISRDDIMDMILSLRIDDATELLRAAYPVDAPNLARFSLDETTGYPEDGTPEYARIRDDYIEPIAEAYELIQSVSVAIAHHFGAHG
ncbi:MAG: phosphoenolpyruvate carboxylase [Pacificimonas sp.]